MAQFKVAAQSVPAEHGDHGFEREALHGLDVEFVEAPPEPEDGFIAIARNADAAHAKPGAPLGRRVIESLTRCRAILPGFVGADTVDVVAATEQGIPVVKVPEAFIEEVARINPTVLATTGLNRWQPIPCEHGPTA